MKKSFKKLGAKKIENLTAIKGGNTNPLHQCAQVTIQVDLGELADVDFE